MSNPYGQNPYGQQPQQPQQPGFPQQGGAPAGGGYGYPQGGPQQAPQGGAPGGQPASPYFQQQQGGGQFPPPQAPQGNRGGGFKKAKSFIGLGVAVVVIAGGWFLSQDEPDKAAAGDCVAQSKDDQDDLTIVDCGDSGAAFKVEERIEDTTDTDRCTKVSGFEPTWSGYYQQQGSDKFVLCLSPVS